MSNGAIRLNTDPVSLPPHNGQSGNHNIPLDTLWSLHELVLPIASTLYMYIYSVQGKPKQQGILCRVNVIRCPRGLRPMGFNASRPIVPDIFFFSLLRYLARECGEYSSKMLFL